MLYDARKQLVRNLNLRRMIGGGRLFNYCEYPNKMSAVEYAQTVIRGELRDPVLSFELDNGLKFIKILPNYLNDVRIGAQKIMWALMFDVTLCYVYL